MNRTAQNFTLDLYLSICGPFGMRPSIAVPGAAIHVCLMALLALCQQRANHTGNCSETVDSLWLHACYETVDRFCGNTLAHDQHLDFHLYNASGQCSTHESATFVAFVESLTAMVCRSPACL